MGGGMGIQTGTRWLECPVAGRYPSKVASMEVGPGQGRLDGWARPGRTHAHVAEA